jgi:hypothetical protein
MSTPSIRLSTTLSAAAFSALSLIAGLAQAAPNDLERVEVSGRRPGEVAHTNVRATCPGVEQALSTSLALPQAREQREGVTTVSFRLSGNTITEVLQRGGPYEYRRDVRRAVHALSCQTDGADKLYVMQISFRNVDNTDDRSSQRVALLD